MSNIKDGFYDVVDSFRNESAEVAKRLMSSACECWLQKEIIAIFNFKENANFGLRERKEFAYDEDCKRDISIYKDNDNIENLVHHIELKVVYPKTFNSKWEVSLAEQLGRECKENEPENTKRHGWIFGIWTSWNNMTTEKEFYRLVADCLSNQFTTELYTSQNKYSPISIIDETLKWRGDESTRVVMKGFYFSKRRN